MHGIIDPFYERILEGTIGSAVYAPGHFAYSPALYLVDRNPTEFAEVSYDEDTGKYSYSIVRAGPEIFERPQKPVKEIGLRSTDRIVLARCKMRPVLVVTTAADHLADGGRGRSGCHVVAPVYSFHGEGEKLAYPQDFIDRVRRYGYATFFYLPGSEKPPFAEGFARLDRLQVVHQNWLQLKHMRLADSALKCLQAWLAAYLAADLSSVGCPGRESNMCAPEWLSLIEGYQKEM